MPPLHRQNHNNIIMVHEEDDENDDDDFFIPLTEQHRSLSDASEVSAYCMAPDQEALRVHHYRRLQNKKVAVIGSTSNANAIICASVLQEDGHQVTVFEESSRLAAGGDVNGS